MQLKTVGESLTVGRLKYVTKIHDTVTSSLEEQKKKSNTALPSF